MFSKRAASYISLALFLVGILFLRYQLSLEQKPKEGNVVLEGTVLDEPQRRGQSLYFSFQGYKVRTRAYPSISYGDNIEIKGIIQEKNFLSFPQITIKEESSNLVIRFLAAVRSRMKTVIEKSLPEPAAALLKGLLLGIKSDLPDDFSDNLRRTGTIHVVVVSGFNISLVGGFFLSLAGILRRRVAITASLIAILFYTLLTGATAPTVRAAIMGGLAFGANFFGRANFPIYTLVLAAYIMVFLSPQVIFDIGFQLSFFATAGILLFKDFFSKIFAKIISPFGEDLAITLSAQALVIPIIFFNFGTVSILSPLVNALVLWTIPLSTLLGFILVLTGLVFLPVAYFLAWIIQIPLTIFIFLINKIGQFPVNLIEIKSDRLVLFIMYYSVLTLVILIIKKIHHARISKTKN
ncbi:MAG: hypothetical protein A2134_00210 [Candidatus Woykebacteria bacterium RBG_16_39_9b]|uniref:ComEC/Rec2-related protein domain-containing protein n=1 Tax=Candidatus Woykebacteria bacterium RBG_16_39_9b TaxID=1802595 RepID=A0A1G1WDR1_9BACT|nr:MAG: hypothetical protein A2134_00210 [Candidatus Woykebacteria bacterium RBG_16_39_9b]